MKGGGKKRFALEAPPKDAASGADANGGNGGGHGRSAPLGQIDRTLFLSGVGEETPIQESEEEAAETEAAEEDVRKEEGDEAAEEGERPKTELPDGFYEIEAIRRKRVRKGRKQYLIKWLDWPEAANTWEPLENLSEVSDVIDAFEESLKCGKQRTCKRKQVVHSTQPKKRLRCSTTSELKSTSSMKAKTPTGNDHMDGPSRVDGMEPVLNDRCRGDKRRKSGSVKKFTKEPHVSEPVDTQRATNISGGAVEQARAVVTGNARNNGPNNQVEEAKDKLTIVKIIKPETYSPPLSNTQEVSVTFLALRSDGAEVTVDNKYLKATNPLLLINYYEQNLRNSPA